MLTKLIVALEFAAAGAGLIYAVEEVIYRIATGGWI